MALALRHSDLGQIYALHIPTPLGFTWLAKLTQGVSPDLEWPFQIVPFAAGLLAIPVFWLAARQLVRDRSVLAIICLYAACNPTAELYSVRVKHYTVDLLLTSSMLALVVAVLLRPSLRRYLALCMFAWVSAILSFASALFSLSALHAIALERAASSSASQVVSGALREGSIAPGASREGPVAPGALWRGSGRPPAAVGYIAGAIAFDLGLLVLYRLYFAEQSSATMKDFWHKYLLSFESPSEVASFLVQGFLGFFVSAVSAIFAALLVFVGLGLRELARDRKLRALAWTFGLLCAGMLAGAILRVYPMGPERTGLFAAPLFWLIAAIGADGAWRRLSISPARRRLTIALAIALVGLCLFRPPVTYSDARDRQAVEALQRTLGPGDGVLTNEFGRIALAYYGGHPVQLAPASDVTHQFKALLARPEVYSLPLQSHGVELRAEPTRADPILEDLFSRDYARILFLSTHASDNLDQHVVERARQHGYAALERIDSSPRARLYILKHP